MIKGPNLVRHRFGKLLVLQRERCHNNRRSRWLCECDCGCRIITRADLLLAGKSRSCGCANVPAVRRANRTHGKSGTSIYQIWISMVRRCRNSKTRAYKDYGGRGITVTDAWANSFQAFFDDVGERPTGLTLERIENDKGYFPGNVRWATPKEQARNRRSTKFVTVRGEKMPLAAAAERHSVNYSTALNRLHSGWPINKALGIELRESGED